MVINNLSIDSNIYISLFKYKKYIQLLMKYFLTIMGNLNIHQKYEMTISEIFFIIMFKITFIDIFIVYSC